MRKSAALLLLAVLASLAPALRAEQPSSGAPIEVSGRVLFVLRAGVGSISAAERAAIVNLRLAQLAKSPISLTEVRAEKTDLGWLITEGNQPVISVTAEDARAEGAAQDALARQWTDKIRQGLAETRHAQWRALLVRLLVTGMVLVILFFVFWFLRRLHGNLQQKLVGWRHRIRPWHFRGLEIVSASRAFHLMRRALRTGYALLGAFLVLAALLIIFGQFPATKGVAWTVLLWVWHPLRDILRGILSYLPSLATIFVIIVVTRLALRAIRFIFTQADQGVISLEPWVHRDVARPTGQIIKAVLIVLALFFIAPLVPGVTSTAAKGLSIMIGLMVSFGSASTVGNAIAGVLLTYMRPFRLGERVKVGDVVGDVVERTFLYTKLLTIKNEEVMIPSLEALGGTIVNYTARAATPGLILHTSVTIGYDAPWRKVHELLLVAADRTAHVLKEPKPFVLQTALSDFFVSYQINAYTDRADLMQNIYSELHQNIQDSFNAGGVEILSPHYYQLRDGNTSTIPAEAPGARPGQPRRFLVEAAAPRQPA
jgi:small-conductance mechanosensitive channel